MEVYCATSERISPREIIIMFPGVKNFTIGSMSLNIMNMLRRAWETLRLKAPIDGRVSNVTGVVISLSIIMTVVVISIVCCVSDLTSLLVLLFRLVFYVVFNRN